MEPTENIDHYKLGLFYFNKNDRRIIVPKKIKWMGWTFNFARYESYLIIILTVGVVEILVFLIK